MTFKHYANRKLRHVMTTGLLGTVMLTSLAACGTPSTPTSTPTQPIASATDTVSVPTAVGTATGLTTGTGMTTTLPGAVTTGTAGIDTGDMTATIPDAVATGTAGAGMSDTTPTAESTSEAATATPATQSMQTGDQTGAATNIEATLNEWSLTLNQSEVPAGKVRFTVTNQGQFRHNLTVMGSSEEIAGTPDFTGAEGPQILEVDLQPGTYRFICDLPGHAARGQQTQLVVK